MSLCGIDGEDADNVDRLLRDAEYFRSRLSKLDGAAGLGDDVVSIVNAKSVVGEETPPDAAASAPNGTAEKPPGDIGAQKA